MKKQLIFIFLIVPALGWSQKAKLSLGALTSLENLSWSIAGNLKGENPNVFSELKWKNVLGVGITSNNSFKMPGRLSFGLQADWLSFVSGEVTDTDYSGDHRTQQSFYAQEQADEGFSANLSPMLSFLLYRKSRIQVEVAAGYQWISKKYYLLNQETDLNSYYHALWKGPLGQVKTNCQLGSFLLHVSSTYSQMNYDARANWNLIEGFEHPVSFRHEAKGFLWSNELVFLYPLKSIFQIKAAIRHSYSSTGKGIDTLFKIDGSRPKTQLNDVTNQAMMLSVGVVLVLE